jgi:hypothetical protein
VRNFVFRAGAKAAGAAVLVVCTAALSLPAAAAGASPKPLKAAKSVTVKTQYTSANTKDPQTTSSVTAAAPVDMNCQRGRKRLWVEGEGWMVRRVTTCF